jgi:muconolactone delta-isomerase
MEYLVNMTTHVPAGTTDEAVDDMRAREGVRARELAAQGHLLRLWRPPLQPGEWRTLGLFAADDDAELEEVLASMPLRVWRHDEVTPLTVHPSDPGTVQTGTGEEILGAVLDQWKSAVDAHDPERAASYFTEDAIFQGLHPYTVGPKGVAEYYDEQPMGMTATYDVRESRRLGGDVVLGYLDVEFGFVDRPALAVNLSVIVRRVADVWLISHYQVSRL